MSTPTRTTPRRRKPRPATDPRLKTPGWQGIVAYWRTQRIPRCQATICLAPAIAIQYDGPRGPWSLDVGHRTSRAFDTRDSWSIEDTRPEHSRCNRSAGARLGNALRSPTLITTRHW